MAISTLLYGQAQRIWARAAQWRSLGVGVNLIEPTFSLTNRDYNRLAPLPIDGMAAAPNLAQCLHLCMVRQP